MTTQDVIAQVKELSKERGWDWTDNRTIYLLDLFLARESAIRHVANKAKQIKESLDSTARAISLGRIMNDLGELQGLPSAYEAAIGEYCITDKLIKKFLTVFPPIEKD